MPFGLRNVPVIFIAMMHDLKDLWTLIHEAKKVLRDFDNGSSIIVDDVFAFTLTLNNLFAIIEAICQVAQKYHLTFKLKKAQFLPKEVEFVGVNISIKGNSPAQSKFSRLQSLPMPTTPQDIMSFLGFTGFYLQWILFYEYQCRNLREASKLRPLDHKFDETQWTKSHIKEWANLKKFILSKPILQRPIIHKQFYLKTDFSTFGLGYCLCQPSDDKEAIEAMEREIAGSKCEFKLTV